MKLSQQVSSPELSNKLKELGVKQKSLFWWVKGKMNYGYEGEWDIDESDNYFLFDHVVGHTFSADEFRLSADDLGEYFEDFEKLRKKTKKIQKKRMKDICSAFTVAELGEMLPAEYITRKIGERWRGRRIGENYATISESETEADARAKIIVHLLEDKSIINNK